MRKKQSAQTDLRCRLFIYIFFTKTISCQQSPADRYQSWRSALTAAPAAQGRTGSECSRKQDFSLACVALSTCCYPASAIEACDRCLPELGKDERQLRPRRQAGRTTVPRRVPRAGGNLMAVPWKRSSSRRVSRRDAGWATSSPYFIRILASPLCPVCYLLLVFRALTRRN